MNYQRRFLAKILFIIIIISTFQISCSNCKEFDLSSATCKEEKSQVTTQSICPDPNNTAIVGVENRQWSTLDFKGDWKSQVHLQTINPSSGYHHVKWELKLNRQTCSSGHTSVEGSGSRSYLLISHNKTALHMKVTGNRNYIEYTAYGCVDSAEKDCATVVERGTINLDVNYVP
ncbi:MAG: hypothetical protein SGI74_12475 [Oligoflexia bacterium]|nr:hypothetical protein [Oligoflexia bacterium]